MKYISYDYECNLSHHYSALQLKRCWEGKTKKFSMAQPLSTTLVWSVPKPVNTHSHSSVSSNCWPLCA